MGINHSCKNVQFNPIVAKTPKDSCNWQLVACSCKKGGYNLVDLIFASETTLMHPWAHEKEIESPT